MNEKELIKAYRDSEWQRYELVAPNIYPDWQFKEMDILCIRKSGFVDEIEVKLTKSDFKADFKKTVCIECEPYRKGRDTHLTRWNDENKHECLQKGLNICNYFSFLMTEELAEKCDIPDYAGLYVCDGRWIRQIKKAKRLHSRKISMELKYKIARKMAYRFWCIQNG